MFKNLLKKPDKELIMRILMIVIIICMALLTFDVFSKENDGRKQIVDADGAEEIVLSKMLSEIKGAGEIEVMIKYNDDNEVQGVLVLSSGAKKATVKNDLTNAVAALYDISTQNVMVFEKESGGIDYEN